MTAEQIVSTYYDAWRSRSGDFSSVPLADDFEFRGPLASFDNAAGFREMAGRAGAMVTSFEVRQQFVDGNRVSSIVDWEMSLPVGPMTAAEILEVADGRLVRGELIYDAEELRAAMGAVDSAT
jgi:ketosteroid isomerase-like protein